SRVVPVIVVPGHYRPLRKMRVPRLPVGLHVVSPMVTVDQQQPDLRTLPHRGDLDGKALDQGDPVREPRLGYRFLSGETCRRLREHLPGLALPRMIEPLVRVPLAREVPGVHSEHVGAVPRPGAPCKEHGGPGEEDTHLDDGLMSRHVRGEIRQTPRSVTTHQARFHVGQLEPSRWTAANASGSGTANAARSSARIATIRFVKKSLWLSLARRATPDRRYRVAPSL